MKRSLIAGLATGFGLLALAAAPASAADLPRHSMPYKAPAYVTGYNWTGIYAGLHGGYSWGDSNGIDLTGGFFGGQIGYNWQAMGSPWVLGVELDSAWADLGSTNTIVTPAGIVSVSSNADYMGTFRGRIGYAFDRTLLYATGGIGWISNTVSVNATVGPFIAGVSDSQWHVGGVVGAGVEHAFAPNWSGKIEYLYHGYGNATYFNTALGGISADADTHTIKAGVNFRFR
jgi:outer membrane immunogenic protein